MSCPYSAEEQEKQLKQSDTTNKSLSNDHNIDPISPKSQEPSTQNKNEESCPYSDPNNALKQEISTLNNIPITPNTNEQPKNTQSSLSTERESSSIPMSGKFQGQNWIYPSPQMFYNAMKRKNHNPNEKDMPIIVPIHNMINEQCWKLIIEWEKMYDTKSCDGPKLIKFQGKPQEYTIRARLFHFFGYTLPFDRHDWVIDRCGKQVTYIIDFYTGNQKNSSVFLDVRPDLSLHGCFSRVKKFFYGIIKS